MFKQAAVVFTAALGATGALLWVTTPRAPEAAPAPPDRPGEARFRLIHSTQTLPP